jgi:thiol-disulfide isomerase/thioredoxin
LGVQSILVIEGILSLMNNSVSYNAIEHVLITNWSSAFIALIIPIVIWFLLKPILKRNQAAKYEKRSYLQLKYNAQVFTSLLQKQPSILAYPTKGLGITIGNPNASKTIIKVCNPYCGPCATAHPELEKIVKENRSIKAQIIFTTTNNEQDRGLKPVKHLLAIASKGDELLTERALDDWYLAKEKNYDQFANKYPMNGELQNQIEKIDLMRKWCDKVNIQYTPTIFIDGYELPKSYQLKDLNYFLS